MHLGYFSVSFFDSAVFCLIGCSNLVFWKYRPAQALGCLVTGLFFGQLLPLFSQDMEFRLHSQPTETFDAFTMLYTLLKFPLYWGVGLLQQIVLLAKRPQ